MPMCSWERNETPRHPTPKKRYCQYALGRLKGTVYHVPGLRAAGQGSDTGLAHPDSAAQREQMNLESKTNAPI